MSWVLPVAALSIAVGCGGSRADDDCECEGALEEGGALVHFECGEEFCFEGALYECRRGGHADRVADDCPEPDGDADSDTDADSDSDSDSDIDSDSDSDSGGFNTEDPVLAIAVGKGELADQVIEDGQEIYYRLDLPSGTHGMFEVLFRERDGDIDLTLYDHEMRELQEAVSATDDERLSVFNPFADETFYCRVELYSGSTQTFDLNVELTPLDISSPVCKGSSCGELRQFPAPVSEELGYFPDERAEYHFLRHAALQAIMYAARQVYLEVPDTTPLGVTQVGQADGRIPGMDVGEQWHPDGTHTDGFDADTAYYRTDGPNVGGYICEDEICEVDNRNGCYCQGNQCVDYFCDSTSDHWVDVERMALYYGHLFESGIIRVIGADRIVVQDIQDAAEQLNDEGRMSDEAYQGIMSGLACSGSYDDCWEAYWAFHVHHTHISTTR